MNGLPTMVVKEAIRAQVGDNWGINHRQSAGLRGLSKGDVAGVASMYPDPAVRDPNLDLNQFVTSSAAPLPSFRWCAPGQGDNNRWTAGPVGGSPGPSRYSALTAPVIFSPAKVHRPQRHGQLPANFKRYLRSQRQRLRNEMILSPWTASR